MAKKDMRSSQDSNLGPLNSSQMLLPTEPTRALALEQRIDGIYPQTLSDPQAGSLLLYDFVATSELGNSRNRTYSFSTVTFGLL